MNLNIFAEFPTLDAHAPEGYQVEFLGHISKCEYQVRAATGGNAVRPAIDHEIFEWIAILESVIAARSSFTMVDLGAGYGRWTARAACALRLKRSELQSRFVAVEGRSGRNGPNGGPA